MGGFILLVYVIVFGYISDKFFMNKAKHFLTLAWVQAVIATSGSLFLSDVMGFPPCKLCWYQRIAMYPLVILLYIAILKKDKKIAVYTLSLAIIGWGIALYHNLLYYKILPDSIKPCELGISCTTKYIEWFGFVTIPLLAFIAFTIIIIALGLYHKKIKQS